MIKDDKRWSWMINIKRGICLFPLFVQVLLMMKYKNMKSWNLSLFITTQNDNNKKLKWISTVLKKYLQSERDFMKQKHEEQSISYKYYISSFNELGMK